ncbi:MAG: hypothetical protein DSY82_01900 [Flavobacteriia bacterium]|nr:MAG: hypothetical protein DSY82_01900 [Flavobacteriia bacterium]
MCTVTFLPFDNGDFILTSSRDVPFARKKAETPQKYIEEETALIYPKDGQAGGTWIGISDKKRLICLLNGGFKKHQQKDQYAKSRGIIVKDLLKADDITRACKTIDLENVEPFTLVIVEWDFKLFLFEFVWDGKTKHLKILSNKPYIWSSSTLYSDEMKKMRKDWFNTWLKDTKTQNSDLKKQKQNILQFHHRAGTGNPEIDVLMKRPEVGTVSITQVYKTEEEVQMDYEEIN